MLLNGSERQESLLTFAKTKKFTKLSQITATSLDTWRDSWVFRADSYSMKIHNASVKAFFTWAVRFDYLAKNPCDKLDSISVEEVPTLPLTPGEFSLLLASVDACRESDRITMTTILLLMRWSGLSITDASCLRRDCARDAKDASAC